MRHFWSTDVPLFVRAMALASKTLFIAGPPDLVDEEKSFQRLVSRDPAVQEKLLEQDAALRGDHGGILRVVSAAKGETLAEYKLPALPVWDGMAVTNGRLFLSTEDGRVLGYVGE